MSTSFFQTVYEPSSSMSLDFRKLDERTLRMTYRYRDVQGQRVEMRNCVYARAE